MKLQCPIPKILLPVDGSEHSKRAVQFAGYLGKSLGEGLLGLALLRVVTGSYLGRHISYVDFRSEVLKESETFRRIREEHIGKNIKPILDETEKILKDIGIVAAIEKLILDGDAAKEIVRIANKGRFSTIMMARRGLSEIKGFFLGSVTGKIVHSANKQTVYIVGKKVLKNKKCPIPKVLVPVDGSIYSLKGVEHIACLAENFKASMNKITLLRVINLALYAGRFREGIDPFDEAREILDKAKAVLIEADIPENLISTQIRVGRPSEEIIKEAEEEDYNLIVMGRKGRTALKDLVLGGISSTVLHRIQNPTIAIVSVE